MSDLFMTVDLGNSFCKMRLWELASLRAPSLQAKIEFESTTTLPESTTQWLAGKPRVDATALSSVAARELEDALCTALEIRLPGRVWRAPDPGLEIACREPATIGRDRLYAARGALALRHESALIVDAGTALTVDALQSNAGGPTSRPCATFLGGAIAPGPALLADALARKTSRLPRIEPKAGARALGRDTHEALQAGVVVGFRGAARELVERIGIEAQLEHAPIVITGGARHFLTEPSAFGTRAVFEEPELVHLGLIAACDELLFGARGTR